MNAKPRMLCIVAVGGLLAVSGLAAQNSATTPTVKPTPARPAASAPAKPKPANAQAAKPGRAQATPALPTITVHKTPTCGCCGLWVQHLRDSGMNVVVHDHDDLGPIKQRLGIPYGKGSCHTAEAAGYFVEGHVPATDIRRMLTEKPKIKGLVLPGMPIGSPGMEVPGRGVDAYTVEAVQSDGSTKPYANHGGTAPRRP